METQLVTDRLNDGIGQILYNLARKTALEPYGSHAFKSFAAVYKYVYFYKLCMRTYIYICLSTIRLSLEAACWA